MYRELFTGGCGRLSIYLCSMKIRKAVYVDIPVISELAARIWKAYYTEIISMEQIEYMLERGYSEASLKEQMDGGVEVELLEDDGVPVGYLAWERTGEKEVFIHKFYIDVAHHRRGTGTFFLKEVKKQFPKHHTIRLTVNRQNFRAINFYFKNGFTIQEVKDFDIGNGFVMNDFIMVQK